MLLSQLMYSVICEARKGSNIASIIRSNDTLLKLLIEEKKGKEVNERFVADFKTLADVLIQEMVRHDLSLKYPGIEDDIHGEETNKFTNVNGETVVIKLGDQPEDTKQLLLKVLEGDDEVAGLLSHCLHTDTEPVTDSKIDSIQCSLDIGDIGIWIDPIDSTAQFINGETAEYNSHGFVDEGLQCVTVLIGVFLKSTGLPIFGVAIQPFSNYTNQSWNEKILWGLSYCDINLSSLSKPIELEQKLIVLSSSESDSVRQKLAEKYQTQYVSGAGHKLICTAQGLASAYLLSKKTMYKWDCCGPHAILLSLGGGVVSYSDLEKIAKGDSTEIQQVTYNQSESNHFNGVIAYHNLYTLLEIVQHLQS
ncbi:hypothetical protein LOTGIDRAFT_225152 [Lottia gigantea]|uniref:inositol-1,4-bisphosphate 1-phosphatase n=1 Tax=Lottia gigantea TaxID=225164 RepID=V4AWB5_LOTGI|nr:hypothetical protein LOTGIDRAFT_225152 [Lottia gigantea]ESP01783.1 hypothetical protein LOTGIDRAFT_225152 [Lottia gigantea]